MAIAINEGTQTTVLTATAGGTEVQVVRLDVGAGTAASNFGGTITTVDSVTSVANLAKGTVSSVEGGTVAEVTNVNFGTVDTFYRHPDAFATVVSSGTSTLGTIKAAVSGSQIYVTDLVISAGTTTNVEVASGGTSTPIMGTVHLYTNGGLVSNFSTPLETASGSALVYKQSVDGPLTITCQGYVD